MNNIIKLDVDYTYDPLADALSIYTIDFKEYEEAIELNNGDYLHFDKDFRPVELEILAASKVLNFDKNSLNKIRNIKGNIIISNEKISVTCEISILSRNTYKLAKSNSITINKIHAPSLNMELAKV
jgi:uncharacterized protein YuzE